MGLAGRGVRSENGIAVYDSSEWQSTSKPAEACTAGGALRVLSGSQIPSMGLSPRWAMPVFAFSDTRSLWNGKLAWRLRWLGGRGRQYCRASCFTASSGCSVVKCQPSPPIAPPAAGAVPYVGTQINGLRGFVIASPLPSGALTWPREHNNSFQGGVTHEIQKIGLGKSSIEINDLCRVHSTPYHGSSSPPAPLMVSNGGHTTANSQKRIDPRRLLPKLDCIFNRVVLHKPLVQ